MNDGHLAVVCPDCLTPGAVRNGFSAKRKQVYACRTCGRQFVAAANTRRVPKGQRELLRELAPLVGNRLTVGHLATAFGVSRRTIYSYRNGRTHDRE